jgi:hypothetical protein
MEEKLKELRQCKCDLDTMLSIFDGSWTKEMLEGGDIFVKNYSFYDDLGNIIQRIIDSIFEEHGDEPIRTID